jgi:hypothetical protein
MRLRRLPALDVPTRATRPEEPPPALDADVLSLLLDTTQASNSEPAAATQEYARRRAAASELPDFEEAQARGWFRVIWGELSTPCGLRDYIRYGDPVYGQALLGFLRWLPDATTRVVNPGTHGTAGTFEQRLIEDRLGGQPIQAMSPEWVAARLWDAAPTRVLREWEACWALLGRPPIVPTNAWSEELAREFRQTVLDEVRNANLVPTTSADWATALRMEGDVRTATADGQVPSHLLGRYLQESPGERDGVQLYDTERLGALVGVLVRELPHVAAGPVPSPIAETLAELAEAHPDVRLSLLWSLRQAPEALADFILCPRAAALVTYLVASWDRVVAWDRDDKRQGGTQVQSSLFEDCLTVLRQFLAQETVKAAEYAALSIALRELDALPGPDDERLFFDTQHLQQLPATLRVPVRTALVAAAAGTMETAGFAVMLKAIAQTRSPVLPSQASASILQACKNAFAAEESTPDVSWIDHVAAGALAHIAMQQGPAERALLLQPLDVPDRIARNGNNGTYSLALSVRAHIRILCRAIAGYPEPVPDELVKALAAATLSGARERTDRGQVDSLRFDLEVTLGKPQRPVEIDLVDAVNRLDNPEQQKRLVAALLESEEPIVLAVLLQRVPPLHHADLRRRLEQLTPNQASLSRSIPQMRRRIQALLDIGLPDIAERFIEHQEQRLQGRQVHDGQVEALRARLQLYYLRNDMAAIMAAAVPEGISDELRREAQRTIDFYRGLAHLKKDPPEAAQAAAVFQMLYTQVPAPSYAMNLLAARVSKLLPDNTFGALAGDAAEQAAEALRQADAAISDRSKLSVEGQAVHAPNRAVLLLATGRSHEAVSTLAELAPAARSAESMAFEAVANARVGDPDRAASLIRSAKDRFGSVAIVLGAENHIAHSAPHASTVRALTHEARENDIRAALKLFAELSPAEQAVMLSPGAAALERVMIDSVREALAAFERLNPFLGLQQNTFNEDGLTAFIAEMLQARVDAMLGWQPHEQSPGGFTQAGNPGRRDFVIKRRGTELAVFEAVVSSRPNDIRLLEHFHKLLAYSTVDLLFHVTYSYRDDAAEMVGAIRNVATQPPAGTTFHGLRDIDAEGNRPAGIRGAYRRGGADVTVVFFVIDMRKPSLRQAVQAPALPAQGGAAADPAPTPTLAPTLAPTPAPTPATSPSAP